MITPSVIPTPIQIQAPITAADLATLIGAVAASNVLPANLGDEKSGPKTLADVVQLSLQLLPAPDKDGYVAVIRAAIK